MGHAAISSEEALKIFSKGISSLLENKLLPPQHRSILITLQHSMADCSLRPHVEAFAVFLIRQLASIWPTSTTDSRVWGPCVQAFRRFRTGQELADRWRAALTACNVETHSDAAVRETVQYLITRCYNSVGEQSSTREEWEEFWGGGPRRAH